MNVSPSSIRHLEIQPLDGFAAGRINSQLPCGQPGLTALVYITGGAGLMTVKTGSFSIQRGTVCIMQGTEWGCAQMEGEVTGYYLASPFDQFNVSFFETASVMMTDRYPRQHDPIVIQMEADTREGIEDVLAQMQREYNHFYSLRYEILMGLYKILLLYLSRKTGASGAAAVRSREDELMDGFMKLVGEHFAEEKTINFYASELCVTPGHLSHVVKKVSGFRPSHWIRQYIVAEAKKRAASSNSSMKEIAYALGFKDASHFSKFFKTFAGANFTDWVNKGRLAE